MYRRHARAKDLKEQGRTILAHGEVTGHCHEVVDAATVPLDPAELTIPAADYFAKAVAR